MPTKEQYRQELEQAPVAGPVPPQFKDAAEWAMAASKKDAAIKEALAPYREDMQRDREFLKSAMEAENYSIAGKNLVSNIAGLPSDMVGLMAMAYATNPLNKKRLMDLTGWDGKDMQGLVRSIPGNSEQIAELIGGDPEHGSWLPAALLAPGPGEAVTGAKALFIGPIGASRLGGKAKEGLEAFQKGNWGILDSKGHSETGWFNWFDKKPRHHLSDAESYIDPAVFKRRLQVYKVGEGETVSIPFRMGELMEHSELYRAYPQLKDMPLHVYFTRKDGKLQVLSPQEKIEGISGAYRNGELHIFDGENPDEMKTVILHEVQHAIQKIEDFSTGSNSKKWNDLLGHAKQVSVESQVAEDVLKGAVNPRNPDQAYAYAKEIADEFTISEERAANVLWSYLNMDNLEAEARLLGALKERSLGEVALFLEEMGGKGDIEIFLKELPFSTSQRLAHNRYLRESGEVEARVQEYLRNTTSEQLRARGDLASIVEEGSGVKPEQVIGGN